MGYEGLAQQRGPFPCLTCTSATDCKPLPKRAICHSRCGEEREQGAIKEDIMRSGKILLCTAAALAFGSANAQTTYEGNGQVPEQFRLSGKGAARQHDYLSINLATAEKLAAACEDIAKKNNSQVVVVILDPQGLPVLLRRMDGEGHI